MIPITVLNSILREHDYRYLGKHGKVYQYVRESTYGQTSVIVFTEVTSGLTDIGFVIKNLLQNFGPPELIARLEAIEARLPVLNS